ncbi:MAG: hypothetical protein MPW14_21220 [Candidatus Manganitrophus sp.]|nr:MAG: hypothetical protein MPW14_21220 [Candidatus Manganitrophus sp.]
MKRNKLSFLTVFCFLLISCSIPVHTISPNPSNPIRTVAVLPMYNATNDVEGPRVVRELTEKRIKNGITPASR